MKNKSISKLLTHRLRRRSGEPHELAAQLAPPEELVKISQPGHAEGSHVAAHESGAIVVGVEKSHLAKEVVDGEKRSGLFGLDLVVIVIAGLMLAFIAFIAWQVSQMAAPK